LIKKGAIWRPFLCAILGDNSTYNFLNKVKADAHTASKASWL